MAVADSLKKNFPDKKRSPYLMENYQKYISEPIRVGFMEMFPEKEDSTTHTIIVKEKCRNIDVSVEVRQIKVTFGPDKTECSALITDNLCIDKYLPHGGFNSFSHEDTAYVMEKAIVLLAFELNLILCQKICSWPFAKAITTPLTESHENSI